jgi:hypothetical protein
MLQVQRKLHEKKNKDIDTIKKGEGGSNFL